MRNQRGEPVSGKLNNRPVPETLFGQKRPYTEFRTLIEHRTELIGVATRPTPQIDQRFPPTARRLGYFSLQTATRNCERCPRRPLCVAAVRCSAT